MKIRLFRTIYSRTTALLLLSLLLALVLLTAMLYQFIREDKTEARLNELMTHAEEIAYVASWRSLAGGSLYQYLIIKVLAMQQAFDACIRVLDAYGADIVFGVERGRAGVMSDEMTQMYLRQVGGSGEAVKTRAPSEDGGDLFLVAVPWMENNAVEGVVFIHTRAQTIEASYRPILERVALAMVVAAALSSALLFLVVLSVTRPLRRITAAAERIAKGDFDINLPEGGVREIAVLSGAFGQMATELAKLEQMRRSFVSDVSHELRSPLTSIQGFLQGMSDGVIPEREHGKYIGIALDETRRMNRLVAALLDLSRIDSGKYPLNIEAFELNELIRKVVVRMEGILTASFANVDLQFEREQCYVSADGERVDQVLTNLVDNAAKYGGRADASGTLTICAAAHDGRATVTVRDDGEGIPEAELPYIFERFHTVDKARTSGRGTGLGLAIVKKILDLHGQSISVTSAAGHGTLFAFTLPLAHTPTPTPSHKQAQTGRGVL